MEIKIETKFNLEENVFYIEDKKIKHAYITRIDINVDLIRATNTDNLRIMTRATYYFYEDNDIGKPIISKNEYELFATKEELYKSME